MVKIRPKTNVEPSSKKALDDLKSASDKMDKLLKKHEHYLGKNVLSQTDKIKTKKIKGLRKRLEKIIKELSEEAAQQ